MLWLKLAGVGILSLALAIGTSFTTGKAMIDWKANSHARGVVIALFIGAVVGNLAVFFLGFRALTILAVGPFATRYWLVPAAVLVLALALVVLWWMLNIRSIP